MSTFEIIALLGAVCGIIMVTGGIMLLRVGAIRLSEVGNKGAFAVQIRKDIKITTSYPALGIFVIGLLFVALSTYMTKPESEIPLSILGHLDIPDPSSVRIQVEPDQVAVSDCPDSTGKFDKTLHPGIQRVKVTIVASGYEPAKKEFVLDVQRGRFGTPPVVKLPANLVFNKIVANPGAGEIKPVANAEKLPPLTAAAAF